MPAGTDHFNLHPAARLSGAALPEIVQTGGNGAIAAQPAARALATAFACAAANQPFRIGGGSEPPLPGKQPMFETLTSGTSGAPNRILRTHASWIASFRINAVMFGIGPGTNVAVLGDLSHSLALYGALEALHLGAALHLMSDLRPDRHRTALGSAEVHVLYTTPTQARLMSGADGPLLTALRCIFIGGSKLDATLREKFAQIAPDARLFEVYGAAETSFLTLGAPDDAPLSVGKPYPGVQLDIRDPKGCSVPDGQPGEVWAQSPYLFDRYANGQGTAVWQNDWLSVGEIGRLENGLLYLSGRKNRIVQIADQTVYPEAIEAYMATLAGISHVAVVAEPDAKRGNVLIAIATGDASRQMAILAATRARFGPLSCPRRIDWRAEWPTLGSGKTDLAALQMRVE